MKGKEERDLSQARRVQRDSMYRLSLGIGNAALPTADGIDAYTDSRFQTIDNFSKTKAPDGKSISEALNASTDPSATRVKTAIGKALELTPKTQNATAAFKADIDEVEKAIKNPAAKYHPEDLVSYLHELKGNAHKAIVAQHAKETADLQALFKEPPVSTFVADLKTSLNANDGQVKVIENEMLATLASAQKKELEEFDKTMDEPIKKMHSAVQKEMERVSFLATAYKFSKANQKKLEELYIANRKAENAHAGVSLGQEGSNYRARFKGISIKDLPTIETITGRKINQSPPGSFYMDLPNRWLSPLYYHGGDGRLEADISNLAAAVKAAGYSKITMTVEHSDPKHALELGRLAFEECLANGFEEKNITIEVGGKAMKAGELFQDCPSRLQSVNSKAANLAKTLEEGRKEVQNEGTAERFKSALKSGRLTDASAQEPTPDIRHSPGAST